MKTPLDGYISRRIGAQPLTIDALREYQLQRLQDVIRYAQRHSRFYRTHLSGCDISTLADLAQLPLTTAGDIADDPNAFLCVAPDEVGRIVTVNTSGTSGARKRVFFTAEDQELTVEYFEVGMRTMADESDTVVIFMSGDTPGSVGDLLTKGLARIGCKSILYGPIEDADHALDTLIAVGATCIVGIPSQALALVRKTGREQPRLKTVLLSTDYVSPVIRRTLEDAWGCRVFTQYGMTEMGLGGGVECDELCGYHMREADLYFEVVSPVTGQPVPDGEYGEVVFTTLSHAAMPLIRYRTGDRSRFLEGKCPCGSCLPRLERLTGRLADSLQLSGGGSVSISQLDDILFGIRGVSAFSAELSGAGGGDVLTLTIDGDYRGDEVISALSPLGVRIIIKHGAPDFRTAGTAKRRIIDNRDR